jgi:CRISPR/Cas system CMR-associated protein Cmr5 small subunit
MTRNRFYYLTVFLIFQTAIAFGQDTKIEVPNLNDKYSNYVKKLESGIIDIDYVDFRNSFLESKQYSKKSTNYDSLKKQVYAEIKNKNYNNVVRLTKAMLSIDYTSLFAHKYLQQTYKILGDTINRNKYHDIEFGLLYSITRSGDGKTCETGWHVIQIEEEYFILNMLGADLQKQSISNGGKNTCDKMVAKTEEREIVTFYFEANKVFEMESKLFDKK